MRTPPRSGNDDTPSATGDRAITEVLFPALRTRLGADSPVAALLDDLVADHRRFEHLCGSMAGTHDEDALERLLAEFGSALKHHIRREERGLFSRFSDLVGDEAEALRVGAAIRATLGAEAPSARRC